MSRTVRGTSIAIGGRGVLLRGESGSGKSDLALRLIDRGAVLVSDDYTQVRAEHGRRIASAPGAIAGKSEVRGVGIATFPAEMDVPLCRKRGDPDAAHLDLAGDGAGRTGEE